MMDLEVTDQQGCPLKENNLEIRDGSSRCQSNRPPDYSESRPSFLRLRYRVAWSMPSTDAASARL